uniref:DUF4216 domain-containing protein n=1 Tax=Fagus sylvatica TaxID=28930 RepID=A0A2N9E4T3_FAGSY
MGHQNATDQLWALANGPNLLVKEYSVCIVNGISQAKQVFYLRDTKLGGHWQVVQCVQLRGVFDVPEDDVEAEVILTDETMAEHGDNDEDEEHDIPDVDMDYDIVEVPSTDDGDSDDESSNSFMHEVIEMPPGRIRRSPLQHTTSEAQLAAIPPMSHLEEDSPIPPNAQADA